MTAKKICLVSSEVAPFAKTGGLADVAAALPRALARAGHDVRVFMPMYASLRGGSQRFEPVAELQDVELTMGSRKVAFSISKAPLPGSRVEVYFVRCPELYDSAALYPDDGRDPLRYGLLSRAVFACSQRDRWAPDVLHCNDWHTGLMPLYLRMLSWDELFANTRTVLSIHNIGYQGVFPDETLADLELEDSKDLLYKEDLAEGRVNFLKTGILYADLLSTVSETYAREIQTAEFGMGLEELLRQRADSLVGIVNGVDYGEWDPATDTLIPHRFTAADRSGKLLNKRALCERLELPFVEHAPLLGIVSRLSWQKGFELLPDVLPVLLQRTDMRLCVLGSGEEKYERYFEWLRENFPEQVGFHRGYDNALAHLIEAGSDMFLMPSRYEPCGLNQMYSLRYGTVPIVRKTGGLADTVVPHDAPGSTGFVFEEFSSEALLGALQHALATWRERDAWSGLVERGMAADFSWDAQVAHYERLYDRLS